MGSWTCRTVRADSPSSTWVAEPAVRAALKRFFARRAPESDVEDLVQGTLAAVLTASNAPPVRSEWNRWVYGIARHKLADNFRERPREVPLDEDHDAPAEAAPHSVRDLLEWAKRELPPGEHAETTLEALLEEADGATFEELARERNMPPTRLRQRATRLRSHLTERWAMAGLAVIAVIAVVTGLLLSRRAPVAPIVTEEPRLPTPDPSMESPVPPTPRELAGELRRKGLESCGAEAFEECVQRLDEAKALDPDGESLPEVVAARRRAAAHAKPSHVAPKPTATAAPTPAPSAAPSRPVRPRKGESSIDSVGVSEPTGLGSLGSSGLSGTGATRRRGSGP